MEIAHLLEAAAGLASPSMTVVIEFMLMADTVQGGSTLDCRLVAAGIKLRAA